METLELSNLVFEVRRSPRRATLGLTVDRCGGLVIHAPESCNRDELARWTRSKLVWVHRNLLKKAESTAGLPLRPEFVSGESFGYLGKTFRLKVVREAKEPFTFDGKNFVLSARARPEATEHFRRWYIQVGSPWLHNRVNLLTRKLGVTPNRVAVRDLGYRWGSCGKHGVLYFNWKLLQLSARMIDYVIAHELGHLIAPHHGSELWRILDRSLPDWRIRHEELNLKARDLYWYDQQINR